MSCPTIFVVTPSVPDYCNEADVCGCFLSENGARDCITELLALEAVGSSWGFSDPRVDEWMNERMETSGYYYMYHVHEVELHQ